MTPDHRRYPITGYRASEKRVLDAELKNARAQLDERTAKLMQALQFRDGAVALVASAEQALRNFRALPAENPADERQLTVWPLAMVLSGHCIAAPRDPGAKETKNAKPSPVCPPLRGL